MTPGEHCTSGFHGPGYTGPGYAASLAEFGRPHALPASGGWVLEREIPGSAYRDAMGSYPLFSCTHWDGMAADLADLETTGRVSLTLVTDPWCGFEPRRHGRLFSLCRPYKPHHVLDMEARGWSPSVHHQRETRRAERQLRLEWMDAPGDGLDAWWTLYGSLTECLGLTGIRAFSRTAFRKLFALPGVHLALAWRQDRLVGGQVLLVTETVAYAHLAAFTAEGYRHGASYALDAAAVARLRGRVSRIDWGGGLGGNPATDGLARYKQGWSNTLQPSWLCGVVLNPAAHAGLTAGQPETDYFPAYRAGEFSRKEE